MDARSTQRWAASTGLASILCGAGAEVFERGAIRATADPAQIAAYYTDNADALRWQALLFLLSSGFALWFYPTLTHRLGTAQGGGRVSGIALVAAIANITVTFVAVAGQIGLATAPRGVAEPALLAVVNAIFVAACVPAAVLFAAVATLVRRTRAFPAWMGWLSVTAAVTQLVPVFGVVADGGPLAPGGGVSAFLPYPLYAVWVLCAALLMMRAPTVADRVTGRAPGQSPDVRGA